MAEVVDDKGEVAVVVVGFDAEVVRAFGVVAARAGGTWRLPQKQKVLVRRSVVGGGGGCGAGDSADEGFGFGEGVCCRGGEGEEEEEGKEGGEEGGHGWLGFGGGGLMGGRDGMEEGCYVFEK